MQPHDVSQTYCLPVSSLTFLDACAVQNFATCAVALGSNASAPVSTRATYWLKLKRSSIEHLYLGSVNLSSLATSLSSKQHRSSKRTMDALMRGLEAGR